jgi:hypothetical protein
MMNQVHLNLLMTVVASDFSMKYIFSTNVQQCQERFQIEIAFIVPPNTS